LSRLPSSFPSPPASTTPHRRRRRSCMHSTAAAAYAYLRRRRLSPSPPPTPSRGPLLALRTMRRRERCPAVRRWRKLLRPRWQDLAGVGGSWPRHDGPLLSTTASPTLLFSGCLRCLPYSPPLPPSPLPQAAGSRSGVEARLERRRAPYHRPSLLSAAATPPDVAANGRSENAGGWGSTVPVDVLLIFDMAV
ncbi:unnamed protein product, partial [Urochloa humidicola]